jgi:hypothetical protein
MKKKKQSIWREIFSGHSGTLSAKRVFGGIALIVAIGCIIYLTWKDGGTSVTENLIMTLMILAVSLLGLPAVTGIWANSKVSVGGTIDEEEPQEIPIEESHEEPKQCQCDNCCKISCDSCPFKEWYNQSKSPESIH